MNQDIEQLKARVSELEELVNSLKSSSGIPLDIERAFSARGFIDGQFVPEPLSFAIAGMGLIMEINTGGGTASVLDFPTKFVKYKNQNAYIPIYEV